MGFLGAYRGLGCKLLCSTLAAQLHPQEDNGNGDQCKRAILEIMLGQTALTMQDSQQ